MSPPAAVFRVPRFRAGRSMYLLDAVFFLVRAVLDLLWWAVLLAVIAQLLIQFGVLDTRNRFVWTVADFLYRITEPVLRPIRNILPNLGGIDVSPIILLLLIFFIQRVIVLYLYPAVF